MKRAEPTPAVNRALQVARQLALQQGRTCFGPVDLFLGLVAEEEGRPRVLLARAGLERAGLEPLVNDDDPLDEHLLLEEAQDVLSPFADPGSLHSDQVLLALLRRAPGLLAQLEARGLEFMQLEQVIMPSAAQSAAAQPIPLEEHWHLADVTESVDVSRIVDAAGNRAREALRVIEDYCRFGLDDAFLTAQLKEMRHELAAQLSGLGPEDGLAARETLRDVGTTLSTPSEQKRASLLAVVQANLKRLQETLRSLEEFAKLRSSAAGAALEALRYRTYTLERMIVLGVAARQRLADRRLYLLVSAAGCAASLEWTIQEAAAGGVDIVQLREKKLDDRSLLARARHVRHCTRQAGLLFIVNDRPDIARLVEADGVHLGQDDMPVKEARRILGPDALIGVSTHNLAQLQDALRDGASYVGVGPTFPSGTKEFSELAGLDYVKQASATTSLPAFVLGGVTLDNVAQVVAAGAARIAVSQAICQAAEPRQAAQELRAALSGS